MKFSLRLITALLLCFVLFFNSCSNFEDTKLVDDQEVAASANLKQASIEVEKGFGFGKARRDQIRQKIKEHYIKLFFRMYEKENAAAAAAVLPRDMVYKVSGWNEDQVPHAGEYEGFREIRGYFQSFLSDVDVNEIEIYYSLFDGDRVSTHTRMNATVLSTNNTFDLEITYVWEWGSRRPESVRMYYDTNLMVEAFSEGTDRFIIDRRDPDQTTEIGETPYDEKSLVSELYENFYAGDIASSFELMVPVPKVYFKGDPADFPFAGTWLGFDQVLQFVYALAGTAIPGDIEISFVSQGDRVDAVILEVWYVPATGKTFHVHTVNSWMVTPDGLLTGFINYPDTYNMKLTYQP